MKRVIRLTENDLHRIVKESVEQIINEAYSDTQYAHLAGQANGALNSFGGRLKGFFNPKWKQRKERQMKLFGNQAVRDNFGYENSSTKGGENNNGGKNALLPGNGGNVTNAITNEFNPNNTKSPYELTKNHYQAVKSPNKVTNDIQFLSGHGSKFSRKDVNNMADTYSAGLKRNWNKWDEFNNVSTGNADLNKAFKLGQNARKGKPIRMSNGDEYNNGTGTNTDAFRRLK